MVTGAAGFIGSHVVERLLGDGIAVVGLDNFNDYYDVSQKRANATAISASDGGERFRLIDADIRDRDALSEAFDLGPFDAVIHLAAMAGVRYSIQHPKLYYDVNVLGTLGLLDEVVEHRAEHGRIPRFVFASSSSVYGATTKIPFAEDDPCDRPLVPYAASKRAAEMLCHAYHHIHGVGCACLRFFTVYGPRNRPDMMAFKVVDSIFSGREITLYNRGDMFRDWTFVDDVAGAVVSAAHQDIGYEVVNIGRGQPTRLGDFVSTLEKVAGREARLVDAPMMLGDMESTHADISKARELLAYDPQVTLERGIEKLLQWYPTRVENDGVRGPR